MKNYEDGSVRFCNKNIEVTFVSGSTLDLYHVCKEWITDNGTKVYDNVHKSPSGKPFEKRYIIPMNNVLYIVEEDNVEED